MTRREKTDRLERVGTIYMDENEQLVYKLDHLRPTSNDWRLTDAWMDEHALLGAVYEKDGTPVPCFTSFKPIAQLMREGYTEPEAIDEVNEWAGDRKLVWIHRPDSEGWAEASKGPIRIEH